MNADLRSALEELADRGRPERGAGDVVDAALAAALVEPPARRTGPPVLRAAGALVAAVVITVVGVAAYGTWRLRSIERVKLVASSEAPADRRATTFLVVGSDSRARLSQADEERFGSAEAVQGERADTLMLVRVDAVTERASMLSIPRDLLVTDGARRRRVNTMLGDGPAALVSAVSRELSVEIDHYVALDFSGFRRLVDAAGGVGVPFEAATRDRGSGLRVGPGCARLDGEAALALVRSRRFEKLVGGRWQADPTGDLGRIGRQQDFVRRLFSQVTREAASNPLFLNRMLAIAADTATVDAGLSLRDLARFARDLRQYEQRGIDSTILPVVPATGPGGAAVLQLQQPDASGVVDRFLGGGVEPAPGGDGEAAADADRAPAAIC